MITIIGAGFSSLNLAFFLSRRGEPVRVLERQDQAGGLLGSPMTPYGPIERAALTTLNTAAFEEVCDAAGVDLLKIDRKRAGKRFIYRDGPRQFPLTAGEAAMMAAKLSGALAGKRFRPRDGETLKDWGLRVLGPGATRYVLEPFFQGVYAGDSTRLSAPLLLGTMLDTMGRKPRPPKPRLRGTVAPAAGFGDLTAKLHRHLAAAGVTFVFGEAATVPDRPDHPHVVCSGLAALPEVLGPARAARLPGEIETVPLVSVSLVFPPAEMNALTGFGCLFPREDGVTTLGALFMSHMFPARHPDFHVETYLMGGAFNQDICTWSDEDLLAAAQRDRRRLTGRDTPFVHHLIHRWPQALPHYTFGLERLLKDGLPREDNLHVFGNWTGSVGLSRLSEKARMLAAQLTERR